MKPPFLARNASVMLLAVAASLFAAPASAHKYDRDDEHPLRYVAYVFHPIGVAFETVVSRPIHWFVSFSKFTNEWFGHYPDPAMEKWAHLHRGATISAEEPAATETAAAATTDGAPSGEVPAEVVPLPELATIYFDYDDSSIRGDQLSHLDANLTFLKENPETTILVEGHCDERGTIEYNYALGERRANSVIKYLTDNGIDASRIRMVSKGEEEPAAQGSDESAWSQNRRAEFEETR